MLLLSVVIMIKYNFFVIIHNDTMRDKYNGGFRENYSENVIIAKTSDFSIAQTTLYDYIPWVYGH